MITYAPAMVSKQLWGMRGDNDLVTMAPLMCPHIHYHFALRLPAFEALISLL